MTVGASASSTAHTGLHPGTHAARNPDHPAVIMADSGDVVTYGELDECSKRFAQLLHAHGIRPGDHLAVMLENHKSYFEVFWGAQRAGLLTTPINWHLKASEAGYIVEDCGATAFVTSGALRGIAEQLLVSLHEVDLRLAVDGPIEGYLEYATTLARYPAEPLLDEVEGSFMFYSSGTTGRPKGIRPELTTIPFGEGGGSFISLLTNLYGFDRRTVYLCPAPLYHAAPLGWTTAAQRLGATVVVMERFEPRHCLEVIERYRVTHAQFVPTHFVRLLKLDDTERNRHDLSSLQMVVHAAAPCPIQVKHQMIDWWGPIVHEYYAGSEGNGFCAIDTEGWLRHPGSVGRPLIGTVHICDDDGEELPVDRTGTIWFESERRFEYHNDPDKTAEAHDARGWSTLGDIGRVDIDGYVYLTDRRTNMIISGGVNIYPQEIEDLLTMHPCVSDVAVIGVPNEDLGEEVKAVVVAAPAVDTVGLEAKLIEHCREHLAHYKCPLSVDLVSDLPRLPTGKLLKRDLRARYWPES
jgi:acyl-CoA synthetase (AMP-forming)/AMP-acid ligase II